MYNRSEQGIRILLSAGDKMHGVNESGTVFDVCHQPVYMMMQSNKNVDCGGNRSGDLFGPDSEGRSDAIVYNQSRVVLYGGAQAIRW